MQATEGMREDLVENLCTDPVTKGYVEEVSERQAKPMVKAILQEGRREGYIRPDVPDDVIILYLDMLQAARKSCSEEIKRVAGDKRTAAALTRHIYFGLFQKEFALPFDDG